MALADMDNDTRGWIMCIVSGIACIAGTSIICVDLLIRLIPSQKHFRIQDSNAFLACSLSLSFGVMVFSALNGMLPSSKSYLVKGGVQEQKAGLIMMACFVGGFLGIQALSRVLHQFIPSHVIDCDHTHNELPDEHRPSSHRHPSAKDSRGRQGSTGKLSPHVHVPPMTDLNGSVTESTPLLPTETQQNGNARPALLPTTSDVAAHPHGPHKGAHSHLATQTRGSSIQKRVISFVKDTKANCDSQGPCFGYTDPCGQECIKHLGSRFVFSARNTPTLHTGSLHQAPFPAIPEEARQTDTPASPVIGAPHFSHSRSRSSIPVEADGCRSPVRSHGDTDEDCGYDSASEIDDSKALGDVEAQHHHHVPTNAFLSIGLQTVTAIALHKFPEGFITYATNHANPSLGFNVFMALFVHNIADGFAMALPLYLAIGSRVKALFWSSLLGGLSQPVGAGIAVLWFKIANRSNISIDNVAYACLFAVTAGIMASVAIQLFVESLSLNHNRNLNTFFAFLGMTILGVSNTIVDN